MSTIGDNAAVRIPQDRNDAIRYVFQRLVKLAADKRAYSDHIRDMLKDAKNDHKISPRQMRTAIKLHSMTPEKREKWAAEMSAAAALFGYSSLGVADEADTKSPMWQTINSAHILANEKRGVAEEIRDLTTAAKERGDIDLPAIQFLVRQAKKDVDERADWFASVDTMATFLGLW